MAIHFCVMIRSSFSSSPAPAFHFGVTDEGFEALYFVEAAEASSNAWGSAVLWA